MVASGFLVVAGLALDGVSLGYNARLVHVHRKNKEREKENPQHGRTNLDTRNLQTTPENAGLLDKLRMKVKHNFTKEYISDSAEQLKEYIAKLEKALATMEENENIQELVIE